MGLPVPTVAAHLGDAVARLSAELLARLGAVGPVRRHVAGAPGGLPLVPPVAEVSPAPRAWRSPFDGESNRVGELSAAARVQGGERHGELFDVGLVHGVGVAFLGLRGLHRRAGVAFEVAHPHRPLERALHGDVALLDGGRPHSPLLLVDDPLLHVRGLDVAGAAGQHHDVLLEVVVALHRGLLDGAGGPVCLHEVAHRHGGDPRGLLPLKKRQIPVPSKRDD